MYFICILALLLKVDGLALCCRSQYHALLTDEEQLNMLRTRDRKIVELEHLLATTQEEKEFIFARLR